MREGLDAPTCELPAERVSEICSMLDAQSRIRIAVWVRHEQRGLSGPLYDHHLVLGVSDQDWASGDLRALDEGLELPPLGNGEPTWVDIFPESEVDALRAFGTVLWQQTAPGADPLDYRLTRGPFAPDPAEAQRFAALLSAEPAIRRVDALVERLWKGDQLIRETVQLAVEAAPESNVLTVAHDAARATVLAGAQFSSASLGTPPADATTLYEVAG